MYLNEKLKCVWHGGDYNPDQWLDYPKVLKKDIELMKKTGCNVMSVGIFAWSKLEPQEGVFDFKWLDEIIDNLYKNGIYTVLATPSGAMPVWLAQKYPEVRRVAEDGIRNRFGIRHNHCYSSEIYREKVRIIDKKLAGRYSNHPGVLMWHISNECHFGDCHCPLCRENFKRWLSDKYKTIDNLNNKWWNGFWSHRYEDFSQIEPPGDHGESSSNPLKLEWHRFKNDLLCDFVKDEVKAVKSVNPSLPVTTNYMQIFDLNYRNLSDTIDIISWDNYPTWHASDNEFETAAKTAMLHSLFNSLKKDRPFMMMESSPSATNWQDVSRLRRPGMHLLSSIQAVAHGSDTVQYFQWRKSRGQSEQFHGAVIGHDNSENTRVFKDVAEVGEELKKISEIAGSHTENEVAILFDYENVWSLDIAQAYRNKDRNKGFDDVLLKNYGALWQLNIGCDFVFEGDDFSKYKVIIAPMLFMLKSGVKERIEEYVKNGGIFIATFITGVVDEYALSFFDDECYPLRRLLGVKPEETDSLYNGQYNSVKMFGEEYKTEKYCEIAYLEGAEKIGEYCEDFYKGMPAVTVNKYGAGLAYYVAADFMLDGYIKLYGEIIASAVSKEKIIDSPDNVSITYRYCDDSCYIFIMNFNNEKKELKLSFKYEVLIGAIDNDTVEPYACVVLKTIKHESDEFNVFGQACDCPANHKLSKNKKGD